MKIDISREEYRILIEMLFIANWVLTAREEQDRPETQSFRDLEQKFFAMADEMGYSKLIENAPSLKGFFPTREWEESGVMQWIDEYNEDNFWDYLADKLASRDLAEQLQLEPDQVPSEEMMGQLHELQQWYDSEFYQNGLNHLRISKKPENSH